jgi:hypothetical protein
VVMPNRVVEAKAAAGAGTEEGRRPTVVPAPAAANPELSPSAGRLRLVRNCGFWQRRIARRTRAGYRPFCAGKACTHRP